MFARGYVVTTVLAGYSSICCVEVPRGRYSAPTSTSPLFFPHIADASGYTMQFILFSGRAGQSASGGLTFYKQTGSDWDLSLR